MPTRAICRVASASVSRWRLCWTASSRRWSAWTSRRAAWTGRTRTDWPTGCTHLRRADTGTGGGVVAEGVGSMTWQLGSALVLLLALGIGFAWYERSRPPARVLALVAALGALGAIGRVAFAAFPNVKPTSDIVLFS